MCASARAQKEQSENFCFGAFSEVNKSKTILQWHSMYGVLNIIILNVQEKTFLDSEKSKGLHKVIT